MLKKITLWALLLLFTMGMSIGYASLTDNLFLEGEAHAQGKPFVGVYISNVSVYSISGAESVSLSYVKPTNLVSVARPAWNNSSITYKVTLHNNSITTYWYIREQFDKDVESNALIGAENGITITTKDHPSDTSNTFNSEDWMPPNTYRDIYVTYTFGSAAQSYPATFVNFLFGVKMDSVHDKFLSVLNDQNGAGSYDLITEAFDEKYKETGSTVIANIGEEKELFDQLFGEELTIDVDGKAVPVTVLIERNNVDGRTTGDSYGVSGGPTGCEYTVYITVDALNSPTGKATVYAVSYSKGGTAGDDLWYQLGELYEGTANITDYDSTTQDFEGAFDINSWNATANKYVVADGITYLVGQEQGDQYDKLKTLKEIMSTNDQDIFNDIDNSKILKNVYDIVYNSANTNKAGYHSLRDAFIAAEPFYNVMNGGQEVKVKRTGTRAEIIPYIESIQKALDYYNEVN